MVKRDLAHVAVAVAMVSVVGTRIAAAVELSVSPDVIVNRIDDKANGHFLEHIHQSVNGGLWGEMIWDRSFEGGAVAGNRWSIENACLAVVKAAKESQ